MTTYFGAVCDLDLWPPDTRVDRFVPLPCGPLVPICIVIGSLVFTRLVTDKRTKGELRTECLGPPPPMPVSPGLSFLRGGTCPLYVLVCVLVLCVLFIFIFKLFLFFKCFSNFLVSCLTFSFNFCPLIWVLLTSVTFTNLLLHARLLLLFNKLYCIVVLYEACLADWPNARPQGWDKCSVARHCQAYLTVCVKCRCCATSLFSRKGLRQPACLQPGQGGRLKMRERKTRHRQKSCGGKGGTGKRGTSVYGVENAGPNAMERRKCNNEQNCKRRRK